MTWPIWTFEVCKKAALSCKTRSEFHDKFKSATEACRVHGWRDEIYALLPPVAKRKPPKWTKKSVLLEAKKYQSLSDFATKARGASAALAKLDAKTRVKATAHMTKNPSRDRYVYVAMLDDVVYVGLTARIKIRPREHKASDNMVGELFSNPHTKMKIFGPYEENVASAKEEAKRLYYLKKGFCVLNRKRAGGLGGWGRKCGVKYTHNGQSKTAQEWSDEVGISRVTFYSRLRKGWTMKKILTAQNHLAITHSYLGVKKTAKEWSLEIGISVSAFHRRLKLGWTIEKIITTPNKHAKLH